MAGEMWQLAKTCLGEAIERGDPKEVKALIAQGEDVLFMDRKDNTYLHYICTMYRPYVFNVLVAEGLDLNSQNRDGNTPLHVTALQNECCHVPDLMACSAKVTIRNKDGKTAEELAKQNNRWLDLYRKYMPTLRGAIQEHDIERVKYLINSWSAVHLVQDGKDMRQYAAGLTFHDIVALIDKSRFSLMAVHSIFEQNHKNLSYAISREDQCDINFLQLLSNSHPHHILQHAIRLQDYKMVGKLLEAGANVNTQVHVKEYIRGPLYFEAINFEDDFDQGITRQILSGNIDLSLKDEHGRSALIYAIDRRNGHVTLDFVKLLLERGVDIAIRDNTGCTARNVAMMARRRDIVEAIDRHLIQMVKDSKMDKLWQLAMNGYDDIIIDYQYRDTWIYAAGNDTEDVKTFLEQLPDYTRASKSAHSLVVAGDLEGLQHLTESLVGSPTAGGQQEGDSIDVNKVLAYKDKGGRGVVLHAVLHGHTHIVEWLLAHWPHLVITEKNNLNRGALHFAQCGNPLDTAMLAALKKRGANPSLDCSGWTPEQLAQRSPNFLEQAKKKVYGLGLEIHCLKKYEEILRVIRSKSSKLSQLDKILKKVRYPVAKFPALFQPYGQPLVEGYRCPLLAAVDHKRVDMARRLVRIGVDCSRTEKYCDTEADGSAVWMSAHQRALFVGLPELADFIVEKGHFSNQSSKNVHEKELAES